MEVNDLQGVIMRFNIPEIYKLDEKVQNVLREMYSDIVQEEFPKDVNVNCLFISFTDISELEKFMHKITNQHILN